MGDVAKDIRTGKRNGNEQSVSGAYPFFVRSQIIARIDSYSYDGEAILVPGEGNLGQVLHYIRGKFDFHQRVYKISDFTDEVDAKYLYYYLKQHFGIWALSQTSKAAVDSIRLSTLVNFEITLPPIAEQRYIATALCAIDNHTVALQVLISKYEAIKKATVNLLLKTEAGCETVRLGDVADIFRGGSPRPIHDYITEDTNGINWIKIGDVTTHAKFIEHTEERIKPSGVTMSRQVKAGDFLLSNSMSFGRPYILKIDGCIHDGWLAIQNYEATFDVDYLYYLLGSEFVFAQYLENAAGSSVKNLNKEIVSNIILPLISLHEQRKIAAKISAIDNVLKDCHAQLAKAQSLKQGMMSYFFG